MTVVRQSATSLLSCPVLTTSSVRASPSRGVHFSIRTVDRKSPAQLCARLAESVQAQGTPPVTVTSEPRLCHLCLRYVPTSHEPPQHHGQRVSKDGHCRGRPRHAEGAGLGDNHGEGRRRALRGDGRSHPLPAGAQGRASSPAAAPRSPATVAAVSTRCSAHRCRARCWGTEMDRTVGSCSVRTQGSSGFSQMFKSSSDTVGFGALLREQEQSRWTRGSKVRADRAQGGQATEGTL